MNENKMNEFTDFLYEIVDESLKNVDCKNKEELRDFFVDDALDYVINGTPKRVKKLLETLK